VPHRVLPPVWRRLEVGEMLAEKKRLDILNIGEMLAEKRKNLYTKYSSWLCSKEHFTPKALICFLLAQNMIC
jgi:hypothetical protein